ncbi:uL30 family ribosomal protein [Candidatus Woesearchaeota archaeon]|nr:uL30 family ribosomal protein [Candidatus Woesearchaeota archaeon]
MKLAVVRVRGDVRIDTEIRDTFEMLNLRQKNHCVVVDDSPIIEGMLHRVASFATWGPVSDDLVVLLKKKGERVARLCPPRKGYGRKGVKVAFARGGALGNRGEKMNDLVKRMM